MSFVIEEIAEVKNIVQQALEEYLPNLASSPSLVFRQNDRELLDRMVCVEEELKYLREDSNKHFAQVEKRFEQVDKRFEAMQVDMSLKFSQMREEAEKHFEAIREDMNLRFAEAQANSEKRFE